MRALAGALAVMLLMACGRPAAQEATPSAPPGATATSGPQSTAVPQPSATPTSAPPIDRSLPPDRDMFSLASRLTLKSGKPVPRVVNPEPVSYKEGRRDKFNVLDFRDRQMSQVNATLRLVTEHAYWYVDDSVNLDMELLRRSARVFEEEIYPRVTGVFGRELVPGVDNDVHISILHTPVKGAAGYYSSIDEYPVQVTPYSNQREILYIDTSTLALASGDYLGTLAHEFTHAVQFRADPTEETWVNEGLAEMGKKLAGYRPGFIEAFLSLPSISLVWWPETRSGPNYGAAALFMEYLADRYGVASLRRLQEEPADGIAGVEAYLLAVGAGKGFHEVFADWIVANYLDAPGGGVFGYRSLDVAATVSATIRSPERVSDKVLQYSAAYYDLRLAAPVVTVTFQGKKEVPLLPQDPPGGGACWWGNRGDSIDTTLTGKFVLPFREKLTLTYQAWYSMEEEWDFVYVEASLDGGATWEILPGQRTFDKDAIGIAFGPGYTGDSGGWLRDQVDLTNYAGKEVLLRFEYVTDDAIHGPGFCLDDVAIPQAGFLDNADESDGIWDARGFLRTPNRVPQGYVLRVIEKGDTFRIRDISLDEDQAATFTVEGLGSRIDHAVIVVAGIADHTALPAPFEIEVSAS